MSTTVKDYIDKVKFVRNNILDEQERIVNRNENKIIALNVEQLEDGIGSDGKVLKNSNKRFTGLYSLATQMLYPHKIAGTPYDFLQTGTFLANFQADMSADLTKVSIFSTGTGAGEKADFFRGYNNLFGLTVDHSRVVNYEIILPELQNYIKKYL